MEELYKQNSKIVYYFLYSMCKDEALAEDLTQETFLRAIEGINRYDGSCKISTWLCQIARHLLYQHWEKFKRQVHVPLDETLVADNDTEAQAISRIELSDVWSELKKLPDDMQRVVLYRVMKINCDIIQDLMPSYIDDVCSEATKQCVKEHLAECEGCRRMERICRENAFSGRVLEEKQLDGLKKLKAKLKSQHIFCVVLLAFVLISGVVTFFAESVYIPGINTFVMAAVCMIAVWFLGGNYRGFVKMSKKDSAATLVSAVLMVYGFGILYYCVNICRSGKLPFRMNERQIGSFFHWQWVIIFALQLAILVFMIVRILKQNVDLRGTLCITLAGLFMAIDYAALQHVLMGSVEEFFQAAVARAAVLAVMGCVGAVVMTVVGRNTKRN